MYVYVYMYIYICIYIYIYIYIYINIYIYIYVYCSRVARGLPGPRARRQALRAFGRRPAPVYIYAILKSLDVVTLLLGH
jgi:hypothetical protein